MADLGRLGEAFVDIRADLSKLDKDLASAQKSIGRNLQTIGSQAQSVGVALSASLTLPIVGLGAAVVKVGSSFEDAFAGVVKTVNASADELAVLRQGFRDLAKEIPISANELANIGEAAGQLGVQTENILDFTRVMAELGVATNLSSTEAATALARLANITGTSQKDFRKLGDTIVHLGNNFATTESEIVDFSLRIAGAGKQVGLSENQIFAFATALSSVGLRSEAAGTAISRIFVEVEKAVATGSAKLQQFAIITGKSVAEFKQAFERDAAGTIADFLTSLGKIEAAGGSVSVVLDAMGLDGIRVADVLKRLAGSGDLLTRAFTEAEKAAGALAKEAAKRFETFSKQLQLVGQQLADVGITLFDAIRPVLVDVIIPALGKAVQAVAALADTFAKLPTPIQAAVVGALALVAAIGPAGIIGGSIISGWGQILSLIGALGGTAAKTAQLALPLAGAITQTGVAAASAGSGVLSLGGLLGGLGAKLASVAAFLTGPWGIAVAAAVVALVLFSDEIGDALHELGLLTGVITDQETSLNRLIQASGRSRSEIREFAGDLGITEQQMHKLVMRNEDAVGVLKNHAAEVDRLHAEYVGGTRTLDSYLSELEKLIPLSEKAIIEAERLADTFEKRLSRAFRGAKSGLQTSSFEEFLFGPGGWDAFFKQTTNTITGDAALIAKRFEDGFKKGSSEIAQARRELEELERVYGEAIDRTGMLSRHQQQLNEDLKAGRINAEQYNASFLNLNRLLGPAAKSTEELRDAARKHKEELVVAIAKGEAYGVTLDMLTDRTTAAGRAEADALEHLFNKTKAEVEAGKAGEKLGESEEERLKRLAKEADALKKLKEKQEALRDAINSSINPFKEINESLKIAGSAGFSSAQFVAAFSGEILAARDRVEEIRPVLQAMGVKDLPTINEELVNLAQQAAIAAESLPAVADRLAASVQRMIDNGATASEVQAKYGSEIEKVVEALRKEKLEIPEVLSQVDMHRVATDALAQAQERLRSRIEAGRKAMEDAKNLPFEVAVAFSALRAEAELLHGPLVADEAAFRALGISVRDLRAILGKTDVEDAGTQALLNQAIAAGETAEAHDRVAAAGLDAKQKLDDMATSGRELFQALLVAQAGHRTLSEAVVDLKIDEDTLREAIKHLTSEQDKGVKAFLEVALAKRQSADASMELKKAEEEAGKIAENAIQRLKKEALAFQGTVGAVQQFTDAQLDAKSILAILGPEIDQAGEFAKKFGIKLEGPIANLVRLGEESKRQKQFAEDWRNAWSTAMGNLVSAFGTGIADMLFEGEKFSIDIKGIFKQLGKSLVSIFVSAFFQPMLEKMAGFASKLGDMLFGALFGGGSGQQQGGGLGSLFGGLFGGGGQGGGFNPLGLLFGGGGPGNQQGGFLANLLGGGGGLGLLGGGGGGLAAALASAGIEVAPAGLAGTIGVGSNLTLLGNTAPTLTTGGGGGLFGSLGSFFTNPWTIGIGAAIGAFFLLKKLFSRGIGDVAKDIQRDFSIAFDTGQLKNFTQSVGISQDTFKKFTKSISISPAFFKWAQSIGVADDALISAFSNVEVFGRMIDLSAEAAAAAQGDFSLLNQAWVSLFSASDQLVAALGGSLNPLLAASTAMAQDAASAADDAADAFGGMADSADEAAAAQDAAGGGRAGRPTTGPRDRPAGEEPQNLQFNPFALLLRGAADRSGQDAVLRSFASFGDGLADLSAEARRAFEGDFRGIEEALTELFGTRGQAVIALGNFLGQFQGRSDAAAEGALGAYGEFSEGVQGAASDAADGVEAAAAGFESLTGRLEEANARIGGSFDALSERLDVLEGQLQLLRDPLGALNGELPSGAELNISPTDFNVNFQIESIDSRGVREFIQRDAMDIIMSELSLRRREELARLLSSGGRAIAGER